MMGSQYVRRTMGTIRSFSFIMYAAFGLKYLGKVLKATRITTFWWNMWPGTLFSRAIQLFGRTRTHAARYHRISLQLSGLESNVYGVEKCSRGILASPNFPKLITSTYHLIGLI